MPGFVLDPRHIPMRQCFNKYAHKTRKGVSFWRYGEEKGVKFAGLTIALLVPALVVLLVPTSRGVVAKGDL